MALPLPQLDLPRGLSGGDDAWDGEAGTLLLEDYFEPAGGGAQQDLAGDALGAGVATAALDHAVPLAADAAGAAQAQAAIDHQVPLAGAAVASAAADATLAIAKAMGGAAIGLATGAAGIEVLVALLGQAVAQALVVGDLSLAWMLAGAASSEALATGTLDVSNAGTLTTEALRDNDGALLANQTGVTAHVCAVTGEHVITLPSQTTDAAGVLALSHVALDAGTSYRLIVALASGAEGMDTYTAS